MTTNQQKANTPEVKREPNYSHIIGPEDYCKIMTEQHLYIAASDKVIKKWIAEEAAKKATHSAVEVVELGCGPARVLEHVAQLQGIHLTGIDHDEGFLEYAKSRVPLETALVKADIEKYQHSLPVDIFYSQGVHHHVAKPPRYLSSVYKQLAAGGTYILSDEVLPEYASEEERKMRAVIWYAHIISHAQKRGYAYLAQEEAKTLLDDLIEGTVVGGFKSPKQIKLVLNSVAKINSLAEKKEMLKAERTAENFLENLADISSFFPTGDKTVDLSRGDYKVCERVLCEELGKEGFILERSKFIGPKHIGGLGIYLFRKK